MISTFPLIVVRRSAGFWGGCKLLILERETGVEPATSSLGNTAALCYQPHNSTGVWFGCIKYTVVFGVLFKLFLM